MTKIFHGKKAILLVKVNDSYKSVAFSKDVTITPSVQGVSTAVFMGTDLTEVENHGLVYKTRFTIFASRKDTFWMTLLGDLFNRNSTSRDEEAKIGTGSYYVSNGDTSFNDFLSKERWQTMGKIGLMIIAVDESINSLFKSENLTLENLLAMKGMVAELNENVLVNMSLKTRSLDFTEIDVEVQTGRADIYMNTGESGSNASLIDLPYES